MKRTILFIVLLSVFMLQVSAVEVQINDVRAGERTATISWNTDTDALGVLEYGIDHDRLNERDDTNLAQPARYQQTTITGLQPNTRYYFQVTVIDYLTGEPQRSSVQSFMTHEASDLVPPTVSDITIDEYTTSTVDLSWSTNEPSTGTVYFGIGSTNNEVQSAVGTTHTVTLNTQPDQVYMVNIHACDLYYNCQNETTEFIAGIPTGPVTLDVTIPEAVHNNIMKLSGVTRPFATVSVSVDGVTQHHTSASSDGTFELHDVRLSRTHSNVSVTSQDAIGNIAWASQSVRLDTSPPDLEFTVGEFVQSTNVPVEGSTTEDGTLTVLLLPNETSLLHTHIDAGNFEETFTLPEGDHDVSISFEDAAGNVARKDIHIIVDHLPPRITNTNLADISPIYIPDLKIRGAVSEPATVLVYVKPRGSSRYPSEPIEHDFTDDDNTFSIDFRLPDEAGLDLFSGDISEKDFTGDDSAQIVVSAESSTGVAGHVGGGVTRFGEQLYDIKIIAVDRAGHNSSQITGTIEYAQCSDAGPFRISYAGISPDVLTPSLIVSGTQQIGIPINISYKGLYEVDMQRINVRLFDPSRADKDQFDHDWVRPVPYFPRHLQSTQGAAGFINLQFVKQSSDDDTYWDMVDDISTHRENECYPGAGCAKFLVLLDIEAQEKIPQSYTDPNIDPTAEQFQLKPAPQRTCIPVTMMIDRTEQVGNHLPDTFLKASAEIIEEIVDGIDSVMQPIVTMTTVTTYSCMLMQGWLYFNYFQEKWSCEFQTFDSITSVVHTLLGKNELIEVASIGKCDEVYGDTSPGGLQITGGDVEKLEACKSCETQKNDIAELRYVMQHVCDRVACPSAPSLQKYIKDKQKEPPTPVAPKPEYVATKQELQSGDFSKVKPLLEKGKKKYNDNLYYSGSSCAFETIGTGYSGIKEIYDYYQEAITEGTVLHEVCSENGESDLRAADPRCCGVEYMDQWDSACGIPVLGDMWGINYNELKESTCVAASMANKNQFSSGGEDIDCGGVLNSLAGFCTADGFPAVEIVDTGAHIKPGLPYYDASNDKKLYIFVQPHPTGVNTFDMSTLSFFDEYEGTYRYDVFAGISGHRTSLSSAATGPDDLIQLNSVFAADSIVNLNDIFFNEGHVKSYHENNNPTPGQTQLTTKLNDYVGDAIDDETFKRVMDKIGSTDKEYIVNPSGEGLLRSIQCVCLPTVAGYLRQYKAILNTVANCMNSLRLEGGGSSEFCQDFLAVNVCDMIYDTISCTSSMYGSGAGLNIREDIFDSIGGVIGSLSSAGTDMQRDLQSRYGGTSVWESLYGDRQLVHSICAFAFTGNFDLDIDGIVETAIDDTPLQTQAILISANRRFITYNPTTRPSGLVTWAYHFNLGMVAGADLTYELELICSDSADCDPAEGFTEGKCDCYGQGEQRIRVNHRELGSGTLKKNDVLTAAFDYTDRDATVRYDRAELTWTYRDPKTNRMVTASDPLLSIPQLKDSVEENPVARRVTQKGNNPYNFCQLDFFNNVFRCDIGIGDYTGARFSHPPKPNYPAQQDIFKLKDKISFDVDVLMTQPPNAQQQACVQNKFTKFLVYEIFNQDGKRILTNLPSNPQSGHPSSDTTHSNVIPLNTIGEEQVSIPGTNTLEVTYTLFQPRSSSTRPQALVASTLQTKPRVTQLLPVVHTSRSTPLNVVVVLEKNSTSNKLEAFVYEGTGDFQHGGTPVTRSTFVADKTNPHYTTTQQGTQYYSWGYFYKKHTTPDGQKANVEKEDDPTVITFRWLGQERTIKIDMTTEQLQGTEQNPAYTEIRWFQTAATQDTTIGLCSNPTKAEQFRAHIYLVDSQKPAYAHCYEPNYNQITIDARTGERAEETISFNVICSDNIPQQASYAVRKCTNVRSGSVIEDSCFCGSDAEFQSTRQQNTAFANDARKIHNCGLEAKPSSNPRPHYICYQPDSTTPIGCAQIFELQSASTTLKHKKQKQGTTYEVTLEVNPSFPIDTPMEPLDALLVYTKDNQDRFHGPIATIPIPVTGNAPFTLDLDLSSPTTLAVAYGYNADALNLYATRTILISKPP